VAAALISQPTAGVAGLLHSAAAAGVPVVVVTNNAPEAARAFLDRHGLCDLVHAVIGRDPERPDLMKPDPALIDQAAALLDTDPASAVLIGDSVTDVQAGHARGVRVIGYAKHARRGRELTEAGVDDVTADLGAIRVALPD
jgi:phosphoglycolate phosphatase